MSVEKQLADWLENPQFPSGLPPELEEAVLVFRPDLAPKPKIDIDLIWSESQEVCSSTDVESHTLVTEIFAQESVSKARISIEDILGTVSSGPLSSDKRSVLKTPIESTSKQDDPQSNVFPLWRLTSTPIVFGGIAAAIALFVYLPIASESPTLTAETPSVFVDRTAVEAFGSDSMSTAEGLSKAKDALDDLEEFATERSQEQIKRSKTVPAITKQREHNKLETLAPAESLSSPAQTASVLDAELPSAPVSGASLSVSAEPSVQIIPSEAPLGPQEASGSVPAVGYDSFVEASAADGLASSVVEKAVSDSMDELSDSAPNNLIELRNQVDCELQSPYASSLPNAVSQALSSSGSDRLEHIETILLSASADEMIYLTVLAFDLWSTQSAVSRLEGALRVNGATPAFRCAGFAHLGRFYEDQGNWVKAESYYRQALQP